MDNAILMRLDGEVKELKDDVKDLKSEMKVLAQGVNTSIETGNKVHRLLVGEEEAKKSAVMSRLENAEKQLEKHEKIHFAGGLLLGIVLFIPTIYGVAIALQKLLGLLNHINK